jgi:MurNAc alpha-1-phosphate uridylyltransferase
MAIKTAMLLAAGRGERMRPLTDSAPKPLLKIHGKALIEYHIEALKNAGFSRVVINHAWLGEQIESSLGNGQRFGLDIIYSPEDQALETAGGIINALPLLCPDESDTTFTVVNGDIFTAFDFAQLPGSLPTKHVHLVMVDNPEHNCDGDFYFEHKSLHLNQGEKLTFSGIAVYQKAFFERINVGIKPLAPMLREAIDQQRTSAEYFSGRWFDVGTPQRLIELNKL